MRTSRFTLLTAMAVAVGPLASNAAEITAADPQPFAAVAGIPADALSAEEMKDIEGKFNLAAAVWVLQSTYGEGQQSTYGEGQPCPSCHNWPPPEPFPDLDNFSSVSAPNPQYDEAAGVCWWGNTCDGDPDPEFLGP